MELEWDTAKDKANREKHGIGFEFAENFSWQTAKILDRSRHADGEPRYAAVGLMQGSFYTIIYTWRDNKRRIISIRRSNTMEEKAYEQR